MGLTLIAKTELSLQVSWSPSSDNVGIAAYHVSLGGVSVLDVTQPSATLQNLACGTAYSVGVEASDAVGNRSQNATISATTAACSQPPQPGTGDTTPPSQPGDLVVSASDATSVSLSWAASTDNVSVSGYRLSSTALPVSSATQPGATVAGLSCGTAHTLLVDAYDAGRQSLQSRSCRPHRPLSRYAASFRACEPRRDVPYEHQHRSVLVGLQPTTSE